MVATYYVPQKGLDPDALAFLQAAAITEATQRQAVNGLVRGLKQAGLWGRLLAVYPMVGGTPAAHAVNLKDPAAFPLTWASSVQHGPVGAQGQGGVAYTGIRPLQHLPLDNLHLGFYAHNQFSSPGYAVFLGAADDDYGHGCYVFARQGPYGNQWSFRANSSTEDGQTLDGARPETGFNLMSRTTASSAKLFNRGEVIVDYTNRNYVTGATGAELVLLGINHYTQATNQTQHLCQFATIGSGLADAECVAYTGLVQAFQQQLERAV